jgi:hypothetical protein
MHVRVPHMLLDLLLDLIELLFSAFDGILDGVWTTLVRLRGRSDKDATRDS